MMEVGEVRNVLVVGSRDVVLNMDEDGEVS